MSVISYFRETLFLGVNEIINQDFDYNPYSYQPDLLINQPKASLIKLKFILTALFSVLFAIITSLGLRFSFKQKFPYQLSIILYLVIFAVAIVTAMVSVPFHKFQVVYPFLREIIDYLHNPLIFILLSSIVLASDSTSIKST